MGGGENRGGSSHRPDIIKAEILRCSALHSSTQGGKFGEGASTGSVLSLFFFFFAGLRAFSLEILINLLGADESDRAGNIMACWERSHLKSCLDVSPHCSGEAELRSPPPLLFRLFLLFPLFCFSSLLPFSDTVAVTSSAPVACLTLPSRLFGASWGIGTAPLNWHTDE